MSRRAAAAAVSLVVTLALGACGSHHYVPLKNGSLGPPTPTVVFDIVPDGSGGCGKGDVRPLYGPSGGEVTWRITNRCVVQGQKKNVAVRIEDFKIKHKFSSKYPFSKGPEPVDIAADASRDVTATVLETEKVDDDDYKGVNVYSYKIKVKVEDGRDNTRDPEIIIDWP